MANRPQIPADAKLLEEISELLEPAEKPPLSTRLEYWRQWEYIPSQRDGWGRGSTLSYPPGTARQVVALMRELKAKRSLDRGTLALFFADEPFWIGAKALRPAVASELQRFRVALEKFARTYRGPRAGAADAEETAMGVAARIVHGRAATVLKEHRKIMFERLRDPALYAGEGSSQERLEDALACVIFNVLTGRAEIGLGDTTYQAAVAAGIEEITASLLPPGASVERFLKKSGTFDDSPSALKARTEAIVSDEVAWRVFSLPYLARTLKTMKTDDFERSRDDCPLVADLTECIVRVLAALLPRDAIGEMWTADGIDWPYATRVGALPILCALRRKNTPALEANLTKARTYLPLVNGMLAMVSENADLASLLKQRFSGETAQDKVSASPKET